MKARIRRVHRPPLLPQEHALLDACGFVDADHALRYACGRERPDECAVRWQRRLAWKAQFRSARTGLPEERRILEAALRAQEARQRARMAAR